MRMREGTRTAFLAVASAVAGVLIGVLVFHFFSPHSSCISIPVSGFSPVKCTEGYSVYKSGDSINAVVSTILERNLLAAYFVNPAYSRRIVRERGAPAPDGPAYGFVLPDGNRSVLFLVWSAGSSTYGIVSPVRIVKSVVPARQDVAFCRQVLADVNLPMKYYRVYVSRDANGFYEHCAAYLAVDFNYAESHLPKLFKPVIEVGNAVAYTIPEYNASATLYPRPEVVLDVYRATRRP